MSTRATYDIFYENGGHYGPFDTLGGAEREAVRRLTLEPDVYGGAIRVRRGTTGPWITRYRAAPNGAVFQRAEGDWSTWSRCATFAQDGRPV